MIKKTLIIALLLASTMTFAQKPKLGYIDSQALLQAMPKRDSVKTVLTNYANNLQNKLNQLKQEYQQKVQDYQATADSLSDPIKQSKMQELNDLQTRITDFQQNAQTDLQKKQAALLQPILDKAKKAIEEVAKANGFTYIFDSSLGVILYDGGGENILPLVMKKLGLKAKPVPTAK